MYIIISPLMNEITEDNRPIKIKSGDVYQQFFFTLIEAGLFCFCIIAYFKIPHELLSEPISKWYLSHLVFVFVRFVIFMMDLMFIISYYDSVLTANEWNKKAFNVYAPYVGYIGHPAYYITSTYFLIQYWQKNNIYANVPLVIIAIALISIILILHLFVLIYVLIVFLILVHAAWCGCNSCFYCLDESCFKQEPLASQEITIHTHNETIRQHSTDRLRLIRSYKNNLVNIVTTIFFSSRISRTNENCSICQTQFEKNDVWMDLPCGHVFHNDCIDPWIKDHKKTTCPNCKALIEPVTPILDI